MEHVLCVCVEHTPGGVDVMVPVIPVGRGRHPVRGERERGSLWNDPEKNKDAVAILVQARQLALQIIIEINMHMGLKRIFPVPFYIYTHNDFFDLTNRGRLPSFLKRTNYYSIFD